MTDPGHDPEQDAVRRLLAEARHDGPVPDDVRARLDDELARLTAERREVRSTAPVVDLAARRRRRRRTSLLAAAAVVVAGVGLGQVLDDFGGSSETAGDAASSSDDRATTAEREDADAEAGMQKAEPSSPLAKTDSRGAPTDRPLPVVRSTHLRADLKRALTPPTAAKGQVQGMYDAPACSVSDLGPVEQVPITLDGDPAVAVLGPATDGRREVDVYDCTSGGEVRSVWLRLP